MFYGSHSKKKKKSEKKQVNLVMYFLIIQSIQNIIISVYDTSHLSGAQ